MPWAWGALRPLYADGSVGNEAKALRAALILPLASPIPAEVFAGLGLRPHDLTHIRGVLSSYDHTNAMAVVALSALQARLGGRLPQGVEPAQPSSAIASSLIALPRLLTLPEMSTDTAALVTALNRFGTRRPRAVLASMYRHLAHWPSYLSLAWLLLAPMDSDGRLATAIEAAQRATRVPADRLLMRLDRSTHPPPPVTAATMSAAIEPFVGDVIVKMVVICAFLRRVTG